MRRLVLLAGFLLVATVLAPLPVAAESSADASQTLRDAVTVEGVRQHQAAFQAAADANGGTRAASTPGYDASADYVQSQLEAAGYDVDRIEFPFDFFEQVGDAGFEQVAPTPTVYVDQTDFDVMEYSGSGSITGTVTGVDLALADPASSTSGCEPEDFNGFPAGDIALVQRGACNFSDKVVNAEAAGAIGVITFNQGNTPDRSGLLFGTLGGPVVTIPAFGTTFAIGEELAGAGTQVSMDVNTISETRTTTNVVAQTRSGNTDDVVMLGAHLDSVLEGPGIQDNGSGSAAILELALQLQAQYDVNDPNSDSLTNAVRFGWWGAEESGLLGSIDYVTNLSDEELAKLAVYLNFDMIGSPNFVRFVYDGDSSDAPATIAVPPESATVEQVFLDYFDSQGLQTEATLLGQRSDHFAFCVSGVACGGLFTGAEGIKTAEEVAIYGGTEGEQYDPCYHAECDTFDNISLTALDQMSDAMAHAASIYAFTPLCANLPATIVGSNRGETIRGTSRDDVIVTLGGQDIVDGRGGNDVICLGAGADRATGGAGNDTILGEGGADRIAGGPGDDSLDGGNGADRIDGNGGNDTIAGGKGADKISGGAGDDTINGGAGKDKVDGNGGADTIEGGNGADKVNGNGGNDILGGGNGADEVNGGAGDDALDGGPGRDALVGGGGTDICINGEDLRGCESTTGFPPPAIEALAEAARIGEGGGGAGAGGLASDFHHHGVQRVAI